MNPLISTSAIRAFVAIHLPPLLLQSLENLAANLKSRLPQSSVRWNRSQQIHLTLQFLGQIPSNAIPQLTASLSQVCASMAPLSLVAQGLGTFPNPHRPRVLWVGLHGDIDPLLRLQHAIRRACVPWIPEESQSFKPHLTLARFSQPDRAISRQLNPLLEDLASKVLGTWVAEDVALMQSNLTPQGAVHTPLGVWKLGAEG